MGSFNIACGLSNLEIEPGDRVGVTLLNKVGDSYAIAHGYSGAKLYDSAPTKLYAPKLPPIFARYDDYGRFTDVEESGITRFIEGKLERPILQVLNSVGDTRKLYEDSSTVRALYMSDSVRSLLNDTTTSVGEKLLGIGFEKEAPGEHEIEVYRFKDVRLALTNISPSLKRWLATRGGGLLFAHGKDSTVQDILSSLSEAAYLAPGFEKAGPVRTLRGYSGMVFIPEVLTSMAEFLRQDKYYSAMLDQTLDELKSFFTLDVNPEFLKEMRALEDTSSQAVADLWEISSRSRYIEEELRIDWGSLESFRTMAKPEEVLVGKELEYALIMLNRRFQPTMVTEQFNSDDAMLALNKVTDAIIRRRMYDRDEEPDTLV